MAQAYWLSQRAVRWQTIAFEPHLSPEEHRRQLALYARYHAQHTRAFHKALNDLLKLRAERRKAEIGFELQKRREAQQQAQAEAWCREAEAVLLETDAAIAEVNAARAAGKKKAA